MTHPHHHHDHGHKHTHGYGHFDKQTLLAIPNDRLRRLATGASLGVAATLIVAKLVAYLMTDSVSMLSSLLDSGMDFAASLITAYGVARAMVPPDHNHRYGHGKAEPLAAFSQAAIIIASSIALGWQAISRLYHPQAIENLGVGYGVMVLAIVMTIGLLWFQNYVIRKTGSIAIGADRLHYAGDLAVNLGVIAAFALHQWSGLNWFDPVFAVVITSALLASAFQILKQALHALMDTELPPVERERILDIVKRQPGVLGAHDMRTRSDGEHIFIDLHVEMDGDLTLRAAHEQSEQIGVAVRKEIPNADIIIHQDPAGLVEDRRDARIERGAGKG